jgi:hypothetical protein
MAQPVAKVKNFLHYLTLHYLTLRWLNNHYSRRKGQNIDCTHNSHRNKARQMHDRWI